MDRVPASLVRGHIVKEMASVPVAVSQNMPYTSRTQTFGSAEPKSRAQTPRRPKRILGPEIEP